MNAKTVNYKEYINEIREIRQNVFIKEQNVPEHIEVDGLDLEAKHVLVFDADQPVGTGRILPDGHIGRIAVKKQYRHKGIGKIIMRALINIAEGMQLSDVWLSSQYHARDFYKKLGFIQQGDIYLEAGITHIKMKKNISETKTK